MKAHCEGSCEVHGEPLAAVRIWHGIKDWGGYTYCPEAIRCDQSNGLIVFDMTTCPRQPAACCNHPDTDMCCGGGFDGPCDCECHARTTPTVTADTEAK
jgi:hypothetical protein